MSTDVKLSLQAAKALTKKYLDMVGVREIGNLEITELREVHYLIRDSLDQMAKTDQPDESPYKQFFMAMWGEYCEGNLDIAELVYDSAVKCGLAKEDKYDPLVHGQALGSEWELEEGDPCYVLVKRPPVREISIGWKRIEDEQPEEGVNVLVMRETATPKGITYEPIVARLYWSDKSNTEHFIDWGGEALDYVSKEGDYKSRVSHWRPIEPLTKTTSIEGGSGK